MSVYDSIAGEHRISTSERNSFRRCRRRWNWSSNQGWSTNETEAPQLFFGSGWHFALEDYFGYRNFKEPADAFEAYVKAHLAEERPVDWEDQIELAVGMLDYYIKYWIPRHDTVQTLWETQEDGSKVPQVEVPFQIYLGECVINTPDHGHPDGPVPVYYVGTFDRVVVDEWDRYWIEDYKTAKKFEIKKIGNDAQITAYVWVGGLLYGHDNLEGMLYSQFKKATPDFPKILKNGKFSTAKAQNTTWALFMEAVSRTHGQEVPDEYVDYLNFLADSEQPEGDIFIRRDPVRRTPAQSASAHQHILWEVSEMLDPRLALYPNPTRECSSQCAFYEPCTAMDSDEDWEYILEDEFHKRKNTREQKWRSRLQLPQQETRQIDLPDPEHPLNRLWLPSQLLAKP